METVMEENIPSESTLLKHYNVPEEKCSQQISDSHIEEISRCGCKDWKSLSPHLEMENIVVEDIIRNSRLSEREKRHEFFLQWKDIKGSEATYQRLISALLKIKRRNDAELVCKLLQDSCSQSKQKPDPQPQSNTPQSHKVVSISADGAATKPGVSAVATPDPDVLDDLRQQLEDNLKKIVKRYASFVAYILKSVEEKKITPSTLRAYLLNLPAFEGRKNKKVKLLSGIRAELEKASAISDIFNILSTEYASFLNYDVFACIIEEYDLDEGQDKLKYPEYLEGYIKQHKLSEFMDINPLLKNFSDSSKKLVLKFDIEVTCGLAKMHEITKAVASALGLRKSALRILDVEDGCVVLSFLIPTPVADAIFTPEKKFTPQQVDYFRSLSLLWLKCDDRVFYCEAETTPSVPEKTEVTAGDGVNTSNTEDLLEPQNLDFDVHKSSLPRSSKYRSGRHSIKRNTHTLPKSRPEKYLGIVRGSREDLTGSNSSLYWQALSHGESYESIDEGSKSGSVSRQDSLKLPLHTRTHSFSHSKLPYAYEPSSPGGIQRTSQHSSMEMNLGKLAIGRSSSFRLQRDSFGRRYSGSSGYATGGTESPFSMSSYPSNEQVHKIISLMDELGYCNDGKTNPERIPADNALDRVTTCNAMKEKIPEAKEEMKKQLLEFISEFSGFEHPDSMLYCGWQRMLKNARKILEKSDEVIADKEFFAGIPRSVKDIPSEEKESSVSVLPLQAAIKQLLMITARYSRLLEMVDFEPDLMSEEEQVESHKGNLNFPTHISFLIGRLGLSIHEDEAELKVQVASLYLENDFSIIKSISNGAYSAVYLVQHTETSEYFATKKILKHHMKLKKQVPQLHHQKAFSDNPFVAGEWCAFETENHFFTVLEYVEDGDLATLLQTVGGSFLFEVARKYFAEMVLALEYMHELGLTHGNIRLDNFLVTPEGHIKLTNFGISKKGLVNSTTRVLEEVLSQQRWHDPFVRRDVHYIAPEVILGLEQGFSIDWWSMGIILYQMLTGLASNPFSACSTLQEYFTAIVNDDFVVTWPNGVEDDIPLEARSMIEELLHVNPLDRAGIKHVKEHDLFNVLDWDSLLRQMAEFVSSLDLENTNVYVDGSSHNDRIQRDDEGWKNESLRSFLEDVNTRQTSYGFEEEGSPNAGTKALSLSPQLGRRDSGISEAGSIEERGEDGSQVDNFLPILNRTVSVSPLPPNSPESPLLRTLEMARGPERRKARVEDMYSAHSIEKLSELDITLLPPSPGGFLDTTSSSDVTVVQRSPTGSVHDSMVAIDVTVERKMKGYGLTLRAIHVYSGDTNNYKICHIIESVDESGPAWEAGLRPNQMVTHVGKKNIMGFQHVQVMSLLASCAYLHSAAFTVVPLEQTNICKTSQKAAGHRIYSSRPLRQSSSVNEGRKRRPSLLAHFRRSDRTFNMDSPGFQSPSGQPVPKVPTSPHRSGSFNDKLRRELKLLERQKKSSTLFPFPHMASPDISTVTHKVPSPTSSSPLSFMHNVMENTPPESPHVPYQPRRPQRSSIATSQLLLDQKSHSDMLKPRTYSFKHPSKGKEVETIQNSLD